MLASRGIRVADAMKKRASASGGCWKLQASVSTRQGALMTEDYAGRRVVGMDLHRRRSVLVRMTEDGRKLGTARITNSPAALRAEIARAGENPRVVLEATYGWYWAADTLEAAGAEVHLTHPLGLRPTAASGSRPARGTPLISPACCGWGGCRRRGSPRRISNTNSTYTRRSSTVSTCRKSQARISVACVFRN